MAEAARKVLSVRDLAVEFAQETGAVRALDGVSLDLRAGRVLGVVGESGCGKSVTARAILRLLDRPGRLAGGTSAGIHILWAHDRVLCGEALGSLITRQPLATPLRGVS